MFRWERLSAFSRCRNHLGLSSFRVASDDMASAANVVRPRSTPTAASTGGSGVSATSTTNEAWYRPAASRVTVTDDGSDGRGRDQRTFRFPIFGRARRPSGSTRKRLLAVNRAACPCWRDLNRGLRTRSLAFSPLALAALTRFRSRK